MIWIIHHVCVGCAEFIKQLNPKIAQVICDLSLVTKNEN